MRPSPQFVRDNLSNQIAGADQAPVALWRWQDNVQPDWPNNPTPNAYPDNDESKKLGLGPTPTDNRSCSNDDTDPRHQSEHDSFRHRKRYQKQQVGCSSFYENETSFRGPRGS